ncbi:MAG: hypothetical protein ACI81O_000621, partial [Cyclobacteriaceae bacterium]
ADNSFTSAADKALRLAGLFSVIQAAPWRTS